MSAGTSTPSAFTCASAAACTARTHRQARHAQRARHPCSWTTPPAHLAVRGEAQHAVVALLLLHVAQHQHAAELGGALELARQQRPVRGDERRVVLGGKHLKEQTGFLEGLEGRGDT